MVPLVTLLDNHFSYDTETQVSIRGCGLGFLWVLHHEGTKIPRRKDLIKRLYEIELSLRKRG